MWKIFEKINKKEPKKKITLWGIIISFCSFGFCIFLLSFFYMGALNGKYLHNSPEDYFNNAKGNMSIGFESLYNSTVVNFYNVGYRNYNTFYYLWWIAIIGWFYFLILDLFKWFKERKIKIQVKGGEIKE